MNAGAWHERAVAQSFGCAPQAAGRAVLGEALEWPGVVELRP